MKKFRNYLPILLIVVASLTAWMLGVQKYLNFDSLREHQQMLVSFIDQHFVEAILLYSVTYIVIVWLAFPVATFLTLAGGFFFGQWIGTTATVLSATIGASILFISTKIASQDLLDENTKPWIKKMKKGFQEHAFTYLLTLRLMPIFPFFAINIAAAVLQIPFSTFFFGTLIGIIPGTFVYVTLGIGIRDVIQQPEFTPQVILDPKLLIAFIGLGLLALLPIIYKKFRHG